MRTRRPRAQDSCELRLTQQSLMLPGRWTHEILRRESPRSEPERYIRARDRRDGAELERRSRLASSRRSRK